MNPQLAKLRARIKEMEAFVALCERIKLLEKLAEEGRLPAKIDKLESDRTELLAQMNQVSQQLERLEASLNVKDRVMSAYEIQLVEAMIKPARIRLGTLKMNAASATEQIAQMHQELQSNAAELEQLYMKLEDGIRTDGLDPNTAATTLAELRDERDKLVESIKAEMPKAARESGPTGTPTGQPVRESEFFEGLFADLTQAKKRVELVSPQVSGARARDVMAKLGKLAKRGVNVVVYTNPLEEQKEIRLAESQRIIAEAHQLLVTVVQRSGVEYNAVIIDNVVCWEGSINILGVSPSQETMRRTVGSQQVRELRHYLFNKFG